MPAPSPLAPPARRGRTTSLRALGGALAVVWLAAGLVGAVRYADSYYQYRGFAPPQDPGGVPPGRVVHETFFSRSLGRPAAYVVYLPPGYDAAAARKRRYPTLYLLHGSPGRPETFLKIAGVGVQLDVLVRRHRIAPMIIVMPDGRVAGDTFSDTEWANGLRGRYADFVLDVVGDVDGRLRTVPVRGGRVVAGYSEGAIGAVNLAFHNLSKFAGVEGWSGYYFEGRSGTFAKASGADISANSPLDYAASLGPLIAAHPVRVYLYTGRSDPQSTQLAPLAAELRAAGAEATAAVFPGSHDWSLWRAQAGHMLEIANRDFALAPRRAAPLSRAAAAQARQQGLLAAAQGRLLDRRNAIIHERALAGCRGSVAQVTASVPDELARLSRHARTVVHYHLVRNCLISPPGPPVDVVLCQKLPFAIAIERRSALRRREAITTRCLRAVAAGPPGA